MLLLTSSLRLPRKWLVVARGLHHLNDGRAGRLRVTPVVQQRYVGRPLNNAVPVIGRERGQLILKFEPSGRLLAGADDRQRCPPRLLRPRA